MHNSMMYWTNWVTDNIGRFDKQNNEKMPEVNSGFGRDGRILDIKSVTACPSRKHNKKYFKIIENLCIL